MTVLIAIDKHFGGFYIHRGFTWRLCLGFISFTIIPIDERTILEAIEP